MCQLASSATTFEPVLELASFSSRGVRRKGASVAPTLYILRGGVMLDTIARLKYEARRSFLDNAIRTSLVVVDEGGIDVGPTPVFKRKITCNTVNLNASESSGGSPLLTAHKELQVVLVVAPDIGKALHLIALCSNCILMPSEQSTWLIAAPNDGDAEGIRQELTAKIQQQAKTFSPRNLSEFTIPSFKTGTLDVLVTLSEDLPKQDAYFTSVVAKIVDTLRNLLNNDSQRLQQHILVDEQPVDDYLLDGWKWNEGRYKVEKGLKELMDTLNKELSSIDNVMKSKLNSYNLAKGSLVQMQRKKTGNLSVRSLVDVVSEEHFIRDSEYLETVLVAVPKALVKDWNSKYEHLSSMVVPRSSKLITSDDEYSLFGVVVFKRVRDEFAQKCRENKFLARDFHFSTEEVSKQQQELELAGTTEKELWTELLRISRTNFSEAFQLLVHLKVLRLFTESVLRYGLPANYIGLAIKPDQKSWKKILTTLNSHFAYLAPRSNNKRVKGKAGDGDEFLGEFQTIMEQEFLDFVVFDMPWIIT